MSGELTNGQMLLICAGLIIIGLVWDLIIFIRTFDTFWAHLVATWHAGCIFPIIIFGLGYVGVHIYIK